MNDLVTRLRSRKGEAITRVEKLMNEAADHIEAQERLIERLEWIGYARGPGSGPMASGGDGAIYAACPICRGLKEPNGNFMAEAVGHRSNCPFSTASKSNSNTPERNDE